MSSLSTSDNDTNTIRSGSTSAQSNNKRKKRKSNVAADRNNKSHTSFFFRRDENNSELVYCKICELNYAGTNKKPYAYMRKGGSTTNMINHLRDIHNITKENHTQHLDEHDKVRFY